MFARRHEQHGLAKRVVNEVVLEGDAVGRALEIIRAAIRAPRVVARPAKLVVPDFVPDRRVSHHASGKHHGRAVGMEIPGIAVHEHAVGDTKMLRAGLIDRVETAVRDSIALEGNILERDGSHLEKETLCPQADATPDRQVLYLDCLRRIESVDEDGPAHLPESDVRVDVLLCRIGKGRVRNVMDEAFLEQVVAGRCLDPRIHDHADCVLGVCHLQIAEMPARSLVDDQAGRIVADSAADKRPFARTIG